MLYEIVKIEKCIGQNMMNWLTTVSPNDGFDNEYCDFKMDYSNNQDKWKNLNK